MMAITRARPHPYLIGSQQDQKPDNQLEWPYTWLMLLGQFVMLVLLHYSFLVSQLLGERSVICN